jgi:hypothetical protein
MRSSPSACAGRVVPPTKGPAPAKGPPLSSFEVDVTVSQARADGWFSFRPDVHLSGGDKRLADHAMTRATLLGSRAAEPGRNDVTPRDLSCAV